MSTDSEKYNLIAKYFGKISPSADGQNLAVCCPFCKSKDPTKKKLVFRLSDGANHCWVCDWRSRFAHRAFIAAGMGQQALDACSAVYGAARAVYSPPSETPIVEEAITLPKGFRLLDRNLDSQHIIVQKMIRYLRYERKLTLADFKRCRLGYTLSDPMYFGRVIMPSFDAAGKANYFTARSVVDSGFKYMNATNHKNSIVFNEFDVDFSSELLLVEGPFDWAACKGLNAVSMLGSSVHEDSLLFQKIIKSTSQVVLGFDPDANRKRNKLASLFQAFDIKVRILNFPSGEDPSSLGNSSMKELFRNHQKDFDLKTKIFDLAMPRLMR